MFHHVSGLTDRGRRSRQGEPDPAQVHESSHQQVHPAALQSLPGTRQRLLHKQHVGAASTFL